MNLTKSVRCHIRMDSRWANASAVWMGLSIFLRTVYYFGLVNLEDLGGLDLSMQVVFPMIVAAAYLLMIKALRLNSPILVGGLVAAYAINYLMIMDGSASAIAGAVLLAVTAVLFVATGMGYVPSRMPLIAAGIATLAFRFVVVDLMTYILPLSQFRPIAYLPEVSNLCGLAAIAAMCPALQLSPLRRNMDLTAQEPAEAAETEDEETAEEAGDPEDGMFPQAQEAAQDDLAAFEEVLPDAEQFGAEVAETAEEPAADAEESEPRNSENQDSELPKEVPAE